MNLPSSATELIESLQQSNTITIDLAQVNDLIFINNSSFGFYPKFADKRKLYSKYYNKWLSYIPGFIESLKKHPSYTVTVKSNKLDLTLHTSFLMVSNNIYSYGFPATIKRDDFQKALLGLYYFKQGKIQIIKIIKNLFRSKNLFVMEESKDPIKIHFYNEKKITISLDGETVEVTTPLYYQILPRALILLTNTSCA